MRKILSELHNGMTLKDIASTVDKDKSNVHRSLKELERKKVIFTNNRKYYFTDDKTLMTTFRGGGALNDNFSRKRRRVKARLHNITIAVVHKESETSWKRFQGQMVTLWVPKLDDEVKVQFTRTGIQFHMRAQVSEDLGGVVELHKRVGLVVAFVERRFGIRFVRPSDAGMKKLFSELAYLGTSWAERETGSGRRIWLYNWKDDGKPRFLFDKSRGSEFELHGMTVDDDAIESAFFLEKLGEGEIREAFYQAEALSAYMPELMGFMNDFAVGMREHMRLIRGLQEVADSMKKADEPHVPSEAGGGVIDRLFADDALRASFEAMSREEQDKMLGLR